MSDTLIKVEGLYKKFTTSLKRSMWYGSIDTIRTMASINYDTTKLRKGEFWALQDINFELKRGEVLGLIGRNGSGKSTLLRLLSGVFPPDKGKITMRGRIGALIALGVGFHPHMSGKENVYLNGAILGFSKNDIKQKYDEIVDFAEIGDFIDAPVSTYSSGMKVRLGYAIAAQMEPDILLIDEVLSVGDIGFRAKCLNSISKISKNAAVIFVSHTMEQIARISSQVALMNDGNVEILTNDIGMGIQKYYDKFDNSLTEIGGNNKITLNNVKIVANDLQYTEKHCIVDISYLASIKIFFDLNIGESIKDFVCNVVFYDNDLKIIANTFSLITNVIYKNTGKRVVAAVNAEKVPFSAGIYNVGIYINEVLEGQRRGEVYYTETNIFQLRINGILAQHSPIHLPFEWS